MTNENPSYTSQKIRETFLQYFMDRGHTQVPSSALVPAGDQTLLFTNAGMVQFKDVFIGKEKRDYKRATSCQKCVRAGGKHNDLENVGHTPRHHTFFEMLGNFSFGDYFKEQAIHYAWEFLTEVLAIDPAKLWVTVHEKDDEAEKLWRAEWKKSGKEAQGLSRCGDKDNFWAMGDTGPCGPCSEIFYDHGKKFAGDPPGGKNEGARYVEIWNLVFMQYERDAKDRLTSLPKPSVDTGMGLERIAAVMQGTHDNYQTDIFQALIKEAIFKWQLDNQAAAASDVSLRVIADHIRAVSFLITDSVVPSNEGRGYVLRRIMRRALRHLKQLPIKNKASLYDLVPCLIAHMGEAYPALKKAELQLKTIIEHEEQTFNTTLEQGLKIFNEALPKFKNKKIVPGELVFLLYDTYGFPPDLTEDLAREYNLTVDQNGFDAEMQKQRARAKQSSKFGAAATALLPLRDFAATKFTGYEKFQGQSKVVALFKGPEAVKYLQVADEGMVVLEQTPFYAESGGQVGDLGEILFNGGIFVVEDTQKQNEVYLHYGTVKAGTLAVGVKVTAKVSDERLATMLNHSATHLLHKALRKVLGPHVTQKGSVVDPLRLRFDFAHFKGLTEAELAHVEAIVNEAIRADLTAVTEVKSLEEAKQSGALALFDEKYGDKVRIVTMGEGEQEFSKEFCGGTHVARTGQIGLFKIMSEAAIASGIRRIEAITGANAFNWLQNLDNDVKQMAALLNTHSGDVINKLRQLFDERTELKREITTLKLGLANFQSVELAKSALEINGVKVLVAKLEHADMATLRASVEQLKNRLAGEAVILLATIVDDKVQLCVGVSSNLTRRIKAGDLAKHVSGLLQGSGGGKPELAQGGGADVAGLDKALQAAVGWVRKNSVTV